MKTRFYVYMFCMWVLFSLTMPAAILSAQTTATPLYQMAESPQTMATTTYSSSVGRKTNFGLYDNNRIFSSSVAPLSRHSNSSSRRVQSSSTVSVGSQDINIPGRSNPSNVSGGVSAYSGAGIRLIGSFSFGSLRQMADESTGTIEDPDPFLPANPGDTPTYDGEQRIYNGPVGSELLPLLLCILIFSVLLLLQHYPYRKQTQ